MAAATLVDFDHDGDLDLAAAPEGGGIRLWVAHGAFAFRPSDVASRLPPDGEGFTSLVPVDFDRDADLDILLAGPHSAGRLENLRHGQFDWRPFEEAFEVPRADTLAVVEADGNGSWDILAGRNGQLRCVLTTLVGPGDLAVRPPTALTSVAAGDSPLPTTLLTGDFDNDGCVDFVASTADGLQAWRGLPDGSFRPADWIAERLDARPADLADLDGDGDLDLVVVSRTEVVLLENNGGNRQPWLAVRVAGKEDNRSGRVNHLGIGSLLEVRSGSRYQAQVVTRPTTHFGLGRDEQADLVRIVMTNGIPQTVVGARGRRTICEEMALKGSCPYAYTWTGSRYEFFTDLLWAAPLGLQFADGVLAPARPSEFLLLPGDRLAAHEGTYRLQITEELWEAAYFDQVELLALDHPADVAVYSNEKVGPPEIAARGWHTVRNPRSPVAARDPTGRDVLDEVRSRDERYYRGWRRQFLQGLVEPHFLELDLGDLSGARRITLFLTGWIMPTDTSLNVGLTRHADWSPPRPPYLLVPDERGHWVESVPFLGFPGGKPKTIALDLTQAFRAADWRLRIATSNELYWDEAFFTVDEEPAPIRETPLRLLSADLHYRGFSQLHPQQGNRPERPDYAHVDRTPHWPPMAGRFTRFGDVAALLVAPDDRMVVMAAGDELTLRFAVPADPPPGWRRDFVLHNVGWDKDADLNTVTGQTVEPLPRRDSATYPALDDVPADREYLRHFQTRSSASRAFWQRLSRPRGQGPSSDSSSGRGG